MTNEATRMRDSGRSWTEISERLGISVRDAKAAVKEDKDARRKVLSETQIAEDRNGLRDRCGHRPCGHMRKEHNDEGCTVCGPEHVVYRWYDKDLHEHVTDERPPEHVAPKYHVYEEDAGCEYFTEPDSLGSALPWHRRPEIEPVEDVTELSGYVAHDARKLGVERTRPDGPRLETLVRRARKKLKRGKKLKRHYDAPKRNDRF